MSQTKVMRGELQLTVTLKTPQGPAELMRLPLSAALSGFLWTPGAVEAALEVAGADSEAVFGLLPDPNGGTCGVIVFQMPEAPET